MVVAEAKSFFGGSQALEKETAAAKLLAFGPLSCLLSGLCNVSRCKKGKILPGVLGQPPLPFFPLLLGLSWVWHLLFVLEGASLKCT